MSQSEEYKTLARAIEGMAARYVNGVAPENAIPLSLSQAHDLAQSIMDDLKRCIKAYELAREPHQANFMKVKLQDLIAFLIIIKASVDKL